MLIVSTIPRCRTADMYDVEAMLINTSDAAGPGRRAADLRSEIVLTGQGSLPRPPNLRSPARSASYLASGGRRTEPRRE